MTALLLPPSLTFGQPVQPCGPRHSIVAALEAQYGERLVAQGVTAGGLLLELLVAPPSLGNPSGSWTIIVTRPNGSACIGASGEAWSTALPVDRPVGGFGS